VTENLKRREIAVVLAGPRLGIKILGVGLILHLSDVHLGATPIEDVADEYKAEFVSPEERTQRHKILRWTLEALPEALSLSGPLDAIVLSGDITVANGEEGFKQLDGLLGALGDARPAKDRIVVVPGNHDVTWHTPSSCEARYQLFLEHVRKAGYVTPLLDGIDINADGKFIGDPAWPHDVRDAEAGWILIPINSSNYSGSTEPIGSDLDAHWQAMVQDVERDVGEEGAKVLRRLRTHDAARVSPAQLQALQKRISDANKEANQGLPLRIAVIHHQLLPISIREEVKSFESITDLGLVRNFMRDNGIGVILHGHKHEEYVYRDYVYPREGLLAGEPHEVLVMAGATIGTQDWDEGMVARIIQIESPRAAPHLSSAVVPAKPGGGGLGTLPLRAIPLWRGAVPRIGTGIAEIVDAGTFNEAYARMRLLVREKSPLRNVVCSIKTPATVESLPVGYPMIPDIAGDEDRQQWFENMIAWWQWPESKLRERLHFTHGRRIVRENLNQIEAAADALKQDAKTTRGMITMLDPPLDKVKVIGHKFPSFCLVQLVGREEGDRVYIECVGYFRKQQIPYWWPVNVGELRHIQKLVLAQLGGGRGKFRAGSLTTITALALDGDNVPRVAIPTVDQIFDKDERQLWSMAYAVAWDGMAGRTELVQRLVGLIDELIPTEDFDLDGVPIASEGLGYLADTLELLGTHHPESPATKLAVILRDIYTANGDFDKATRDTDVTEKAHTKWRKAVMPLVEAAKGLLQPITKGARS
jgi:3',5'-cyclic AMP phosphodiesterase CpdA